ncbi:MAG: Holliday junction resolvase RuvX [Oscillospiraceae bacterium]|nr:Holliday junction resolvase RuvX [Oscillospiraceae bacterium]
MKRIIAIDYGDARTGVAVSDLTGTMVGETLTIHEWNAQRLAQRLAFFAKERDGEKFVLGLPTNKDGTEGPRAEKARQFAELLKEESGLPIVLWDERRSTIEAHAILHASGKKEKKHRATVDAVAASLLLESFLNSPQAKDPSLYR